VQILLLMLAECATGGKRQSAKEKRQIQRICRLYHDDTVVIATEEVVPNSTLRPMLDKVTK